MGLLRITWKKSAIGYRRDQGATVRALGLRRLHQAVDLEDSPTVRGMIHKVRHLLEIRDLDEEEGRDGT